jgi:hypothetical protein
MIGKLFITRSGYDPELGRHVKDPYLGDKPSLGACRPDVRRQLKTGDYIFTVSGRVPRVRQFLMGGFEVAAKVHANDAYRRFPEQRLHKLEDGQLDGNVIVDERGQQHSLDDHKNFAKRLDNYIIGRNPIVLASPAEIERARRETLQMLCELFKKRGRSPHEVISRFGRSLTEKQVEALITWLRDIKRAAAA